MAHTSNIKFLDTPSAFRNSLFELVDSAHEQLHVEFYIFNNDQFGKEILERLVNASLRGVTVRLIVDGFGSEQFIQECYETLKALPFDVRIYHPLPWGKTPFGSTLKTLRDFFNYLGTLNRRNHRKVVMADCQRVMIGSHNIWDQSLEWQEASVLLDNPVAAKTVLAGFFRIWHRSVDLFGKKHRQPLKDKLAAMRSVSLGSQKLRILDNSSLRHSRASKRTLLREFQQAGRRIVIVTPYFQPHRAVMKSLKKHASQGIDIKILLPGLLDNQLSKWMSQALYQELLDSGVCIYEYNADSILHAKVTLIDHRFIVGSSNLNHRSVLQDLEIDCLGSQPATLSVIEKWFENLVSHSTQITEVTQVELHGIKRLAAYLLSPIKNYF